MTRRCQAKWRFFSGAIFLAVVWIRYWLQKYIPVLLDVGNIHPESIHEGLVICLDFYIRLRMERSCSEALHYHLGTYLLKEPFTNCRLFNDSVMLRIPYCITQLLRKDSSYVICNFRSR